MDCFEKRIKDFQIDFNSYYVDIKSKRDTQNIKLRTKKRLAAVQEKRDSFSKQIRGDIDIVDLINIDKEILQISDLVKIFKDPHKGYNQSAFSNTKTLSLLLKWANNFEYPDIQLECFMILIELSSQDDFVRNECFNKELFDSCVNSVKNFSSAHDVMKLSLHAISNISIDYPSFVTAEIFNEICRYLEFCECSKVIIQGTYTLCVILIGPTIFEIDPKVFVILFKGLKCPKNCFENISLLLYVYFRFFQYVDFNRKIVKCILKLFLSGITCIVKASLKILEILVVKYDPDAGIICLKDLKLLVSSFLNSNNETLNDYLQVFLNAPKNYMPAFQNESLIFSLPKILVTQPPDMQILIYRLISNLLSDSFCLETLYRTDIIPQLCISLGFSHPELQISCLSLLENLISHNYYESVNIFLQYQGFKVLESLAYSKLPDISDKSLALLSIIELSKDCN